MLGICGCCKKDAEISCVMFDPKPMKGKDHAWWCQKCEAAYLKIINQRLKMYKILMANSTPCDGWGRTQDDPDYGKPYYTKPLGDL